jgi:hypothetical protein
MTDTATTRGPADPTRVNINEHYELTWWARALGVSRAELSEAARRAGPRLVDIERRLASSSPPRARAAAP